VWCCMAPLEDFNARDLAWISDFVREQLVMFLQPLMEHVQERDATVEYMQNAVRRLSINVSEMESELDHTSQCVAILRQGLGVQSERRCAMQLDLEKAMEKVEHFESQMGSLLSVDKQWQMLSADMDKVNAKQKESDIIVRDLETGQANNTAHIEDCWRDLRRLQKLQFDALPQVDDRAGGFMSSSSKRQSTRDTWMQQKSFVASLDDQKYWETNGSSGHSSLVGNSLVGVAGPLALQQDRLARGSPLRSTSCVAIRRVAEACETLAASVAARTEPEPRRGPRLPPIT